MRLRASKLLLLLLFVSVFWSIRVSDVKAQETTYIRADGSIDPSTAHITSADNVTYTFTGNNYDSIVLERSNIIVDGDGYTLQGSGSGIGIYWSGTNNVTIKHTRIENFKRGIYFNSSSDFNTITGNNITNNRSAIQFEDSDFNAIIGNSVTANYYWGIFLYECSNNIISGNNITNNHLSISLFYHSDFNKISGNNIMDNDERHLRLAQSSYNNVSGNNIEGNDDGVEIYISANNTISENNITANGGDGICVIHSSRFNSIFSNNVSANGGDGIHVEDSSGCNTISANNITGNNNHGISLSSSSSNNILANNVVDNDDGVMLDSSSGNTIADNLFVDDCLYVVGSYENSVENNTVNGKPLVYLEEESNHTINDAGQVILVRCENITVESLNVSRAYIGIELWETANCIISKNNITNSNRGIVLEHSIANAILGNNIADNYACIEFTHSLNNTISGNNIADNMYGIKLLHSSDNKIFHNNFINNTYQLLSTVSVNTFDNGYPLGGNYWSNLAMGDIYCGQDRDLPGNDGLGDAAYILGKDNRDNYPLMAPWSGSPHNTAIQAVTLPRSLVGQGYIIHLNITVANHGSYTENINVTLNINTTLIECSEIVLSSGNTTTLTYTWNTTDFALGNYIISVQAEPILGESFTIDNTFFYGLVTMIQIIGDVDKDYDVDIFDIVSMVKVYGVESPDPRYDKNCDLDQDGDIDIVDITIAADNYGSQY